MTPSNWPESLTKAQGAAIKHYREQQKLTHSALCKALSELGISMQRTALINLEQGRRKSISVPEFLAFGKILDVPPGLLMIPLGLVSEVEVSEGEWVNAVRALGWIYGNRNIDDEWELEEGVGWKPLRSAARETQNLYVVLEHHLSELHFQIQKFAGVTDPDVLRQAEEESQGHLRIAEVLISSIRSQGLAPAVIPPDVAAKYPELMSQAPPKREVDS